MELTDCTIIVIIIVIFFILYKNKTRDDDLLYNAKKIKEIEKKYEDIIKDNERKINTLNKIIENNNNVINKTISKNNSQIISLIDELKGKIDYNQQEQKNIIEKIVDEAKNNDNNVKSSIEELCNVLENLRLEYDDLKRKVDFFVGINEDSNKLNDDYNTIEGEERNKKILNSILDNLNKTNFDLEDNTNIDTNTEKNVTVIQPNQSNDNIDNDKTNYILDKYQEWAYDFIKNTNNNIFISGKAGTGKSLLINVICSSLDKKILKLAPTGIAALNIKGATLHSIFGFFNLVELDIDNINKDTIDIKKENKDLLKNVDSIIIDEISMVRSDTLERIDLILKSLNNSLLPFGGKQMILVGDPFQLQPIVKPGEGKFIKERFKGKFFFCSNAYKNADFVFAEMKICHRQESDINFFEILNKIRNGEISEKDIDILNSRIVKDEEKELHRVIRLLSTRNEVDAVNSNELSKIYGKEYLFKTKVIYSKYESSWDIENNFTISEILKLKIGATVMFVSNDINKRWTNGQIGIVKEINDNNIVVILNGNDIKVERENFSLKEILYIDGKLLYKDALIVSQFPIILAYAITIHKSQGMTYPEIAVNISNCFASGQEYVALSRTKSLEGLHLLQEIRDKTIGVNEQIIKFYRDCLINEGVSSKTRILNSKIKENLSVYRLKKSNEQKILPYMVFSNKTLDEIIILKPKTLDELKKVNGIGEVKISMYGNDIIEIMNSTIKNME